MLILKLISVVSCGDPGSINNADKSGSTYTYNSQVTYTCQTGYEKTSGSLTRTCQADGSWNGTAPVCSSKIFIVGINLKTH